MYRSDEVNYQAIGQYNGTMIIHEPAVYTVSAWVKIFIAK